MLMTTKQDRLTTYLEWPLPIKSHDHIITWFCNIMWQTKITIYALHIDYGYQFWQGRDIQWGVSFQKVTRSFDQVVLQGHVNYFSCCITTTVKPMISLNLAKWWLTWKSSPLNHISLLSRGLVSDFDIPYTICKFRTQIPKSSPTSCLVFKLLSYKEFVHKQRRQNKVLKSRLLFKRIDDFT